MSPTEGPGPVARRPGAWWRALLGALLGLVLLVLVVQQARGASVPSLVARPGVAGAWMLASALWMLSYGLRAVRLHLEWRGRLHLDLPGCWRTVVQHNLALALLPLRLGEAGYLWALHRRWGMAWADAARSLLWLRLQDLLVLGALALLAWSGALVDGLARWPWAWRGAALLGALLSLGLVAGLAPARQAVVRAARAVHAAGSARAVADWGWLCCWVNWLARLLATGLLLSALLGHPPSVAGLLDWGRTALAGEWAAALPLQAPAGLGSYEAALVWAAPAGEVAELAAAALLSHAAALLTLCVCALLTAMWPERGAPMSAVLPHV